MKEELTLTYALRRVFTEQSNTGLHFRYEFHRSPTGLANEQTVGQTINLTGNVDRKWSLGHKLKVTIEVEEKESK